MMNFPNVVLALFTGFAVASLIRELLLMSGFSLSGSVEGGADEFGKRFGAAFTAGPAFLAEELISGVRSGERRSALLAGFVACAAWATLYGFVVLSTAARLV